MFFLLRCRQLGEERLDRLIETRGLVQVGLRGPRRGSTTLVDPLILAAM
jgi:hypothetical protein